MPQNPLKKAYLYTPMKCLLLVVYCVHISRLLNVFSITEDQQYCSELVVQDKVNVQGIYVMGVFTYTLLRHSIE